MPTLKELSIQYAKKQPKQVDTITEKTPILDIIPFDEASHGLWNMYEEIESITGAGFVEMNAALPTLAVTSELKKIDLSIMGGEMECPEDLAKMFGGKAKYFAKKMPAVLKQSGVTTEVAILYDNIRQYCIDQNRATSAGETSDVCFSILAVRFEEGVTGGLYSPDGFKQGAMLDTAAINGGNLYKNSSGVLVFGLRLKGYFGFQIADPVTVYACANIGYGNVPSAAQIDHLVAEVRGAPGNTYLFMHHKCKNLLNTYKGAQLEMRSSDKDFDRTVDRWNGIPIVCSYNFLDATEAAETIT